MPDAVRADPSHVVAPLFASATGPDPSGLFVAGSKAKTMRTAKHRAAGSKITEAEADARAQVKRRDVRDALRGRTPGKLSARDSNDPEVLASRLDLKTLASATRIAFQHAMARQDADCRLLAANGSIADTPAVLSNLIECARSKRSTSRLLGARTQPKRSWTH